MAHLQGNGVVIDSKSTILLIAFIVQYYDSDHAQAMVYNL